MQTPIKCRYFNLRPIWEYSVDLMQKFILHQFFYSCDLFSESHSFVTVEIYLQLFCSGMPIQADWYEVLQRINGWKWNEQELSLKLHETYNFLCSRFSFVWLLPGKMQMNSDSECFWIMSKPKTSAVVKWPSAYRTGFDHYCYARCEIWLDEELTLSTFHLCILNEPILNCASTVNSFAKLVFLFPFFRSKQWTKDSLD